jgi:hypothetical protein
MVKDGAYTSALKGIITASVCVSHFQPSLIFMVKAGAYTSALKEIVKAVKRFIVNAWIAEGEKCFQIELNSI